MASVFKGSVEVCQVLMRTQFFSFSVLRRFSRNFRLLASVATATHKWPRLDAFRPSISSSIWCPKPTLHLSDYHWGTTIIARHASASESAPSDIERSVQSVGLRWHSTSSSYRRSGHAVRWGPKTFSSESVPCQFWNAVY